MAKKTPEERLLEHLEYEIKRDTQNLQQFTQDILENAAEALSWSSAMFEAAARKRINETAYRLLTDTERSVKPLAVMEYLEREIMDTARFPKRSTSPQSNEMSVCENAARCALLVVMKAYFKE